MFLVLVFGCAKPDQIKQCYPVATWAAPVFNCEGGAPPPPPVEPPKEEPPKEEPPPPPVAEVKDEKIELNEKVQFEFAKAELLPQSKKLLDEVVKIMKDHPEIERIRIEGHTDNDASDGYNLKLSNNRAAAVRMYLESQGVDGKRMESKGFGEAKPIADNKTDEGREQNRRVEIHIVKRTKAK
ncbi:MAG: OmpA family protein [Deltaproteobacteria bacterium]|nr:OmpA family protein [Deltaproteobacteria bacterium]